MYLHPTVVELPLSELRRLAAWHGHDDVLVRRDGSELSATCLCGATAACTPAGPVGLLVESDCAMAGRRARVEQLIADRWLECA